MHQILKPSKVNKGLASALEEHPDIWPRFFFTHDIDIIGFSMDYTETHIWWLINFRARLIRRGSSIQNSIRFNYPSFQKKEFENKLSVLNALEIKINEIPVNTTGNKNIAYCKFYDKFLDY